MISSLRSALAMLLVTSAAFAEASNAEQADATGAPPRYAETCGVCHDAGIDGAPRPGIKSDWELRLEYGIEELYLNTIDGVGARMPPRGQCMDCSDEELGAIVDYMIRDLE